MTNEELAASIQAGDTWRLDTLLTQNNGMLYHIARQYSGLAERNRVADLEDLYQSAALGMIEAVAEWEPERGAFLTVATFYMRRRVRELLGVYSTKERIENGGTASLDAAISAEDESPLVELIADPAALDPEEAAIQADMRRIVREAVAALPAEECAAINNTYLQEGKRGGADGKTLNKGMRTLRRNSRLLQLWAEYESVPYWHRSHASWRHTHTSAVEAATMQRERIRKQMAALMRWYTC